MNKKPTVLRKCSVSQTYYPKEELFRICLKDNKVYIDLEQNLGGRGAYIQKNKEIILLGKKRNSLSRTLKHLVTSLIYDELINELERR